MKTIPEVVMVARLPELGDMVDQCARGKMAFGTLCQRVQSMGFKTDSLYEMVVALERRYEKEGTDK